MSCEELRKVPKSESLSKSKRYSYDNKEVSLLGIVRERLSSFQQLTPVFQDIASPRMELSEILNSETQISIQNKTPSDPSI